MTVSAELLETVRQRAKFACEYCGVTETDTGGQLSVDHFQPRARGGPDDLENLLYCCQRCNLYKADFWPEQPGDPALWNPRREPGSAHLLALADGSLHPISETGEFTLRRLRLNRPPLVAYRRRKHVQAEELRLLRRYRELVALLEQVQQQQATLLAEHRVLLEQQQRLLQLLLKSEE